MTNLPDVGLSARVPSLDLTSFGPELDELQGYGVTSVEIPTFDMDIVIGAKILRDRLALLKSTCADRGLVYSVHGPLSLNLMDEPWRLPHHMKVLRASLEVAAELGAENYVLHGGLMRQQQATGVEDGYARQREALAQAGDIARDLGLYICVETMFAGYHGMNVTASPARLAQELAALAHPNVAATLDVSHAYLKLTYDGRREDFLAELAVLSPWARHVHLHDSFGLQDDIWMYNDSERVVYGHGDLHLPMGWGDIPWSAIMAGCAFPRGAVFNLEMKPRFWHAVPESVAAAKALAAKARLVAPPLAV
ncbi:sugar phosphate isomerase/epimerase [Shinella daejeonensis]|uniref:sugar phosphate isomerase/epimerase family protein n=1 Tax=Shinella daejeonensis TaxID=659017 RepID=UPI0020C799E6|nr:sugar phosphate isomerase/epimerase family protein [Shinella daejeonensis]MCP8896496.1 sugar phosphate isomerase/epimerase [Shinella daejeonensis]